MKSILEISINEKNVVTLESLAELINGVSSKITNIELEMSSLKSETKARHYDM